MRREGEAEKRGEEKHKRERVDSGKKEREVRSGRTRRGVDRREGRDPIYGKMRNMVQPTVFPPLLSALYSSPILSNTAQLPQCLPLHDWLSVHFAYVPRGLFRSNLSSFNTIRYRRSSFLILACPPLLCLFLRPFCVSTRFPSVRWLTASKSPDVSFLA